MSDNIEEIVGATMRSMQANLLQQMDEMIETRLESMQQQLTAQQKKMTDLQMSKINKLKFKDNYIFRKKGNEDQYKVNAKVNEKISEAKAELEVIMTEDNRIETALRKIDEGIDIIKDRQKLILMADSFETGWAAVKEYTRNELAEDSEDEKRMLRATARAVKKAGNSTGNI